MTIGVLSPNVIICSFDDFLWASDYDSEKLLIDRIDGCKIHITNSPTFTIVGYVVWEATHPSSWIQWVDKFTREFDNVNFTMILNTHYKHYEYNFSFSVDYIDFFVMRTWFETVIKIDACGYNKEWNHDSNKFLFIFGKLQKPHRIRLLYKLHKRQLLDNCIWSLRKPTNEIYDIAKKLIPELSNSEFDDFINSHISEPDNIVLGASSNFNYGGFPYDKSLFSSTLFRLSPECYISRTNEKDTVPWITEKTWITILNNHPFIIPGENGILRYLEDMGFKTFNDYLPVQYDTLPTVEGKLDAYVDNTEYLLLNHKNHTNEIKEDITHNFTNFVKLVKENENKLYNIGLRLGLSHIDPYRIIPLVDDLKNDKWMRFYSEIKDKSWEPCLYEDDFNTLPKNIQDECINFFNYSPNNDK